MPEGRRHRVRDRDLGCGPAKIPAPGPAAGQTAYVFTAIGTPGAGRRAEAAAERHLGQPDHRQVRQRHAQAQRPDINPDGPTTLSAVVDTGSGSIMSTIFGQVTTTENQCQFMPTIGSTVIP